MTQPELAINGGCIGVSKFIEEIIVAKRNAHRSERYIKSLSYYLRQFAAGRESKPLNEFTFHDIEAWLSRYPSAYTKQTWLNRLSTLFAFGVRRGYIQHNPCDRLERITIDQKPPAVLTVAQSRQLLSTCPAVCRPYLILGMYAGVRPEEILRIDWKDINLETGVVHVDGRKTHRRRIVPLHPLALELLKAHPVQTGPVSPSDSTIDRWKIKARKLLGLEKWPQDVLRHTAASYLIALYGDAGKVATMLGNSAKILLTHYHEPVTKAECEKFWELPSSSF